jgi:hypothetical protein
MFIEMMMTTIPSGISNTLCSQFVSNVASSIEDLRPLFKNIPARNETSTQQSLFILEYSLFCISFSL